MEKFNEAEKEAMEMYLEDLVELFGPRNPNKFCYYYNKGRKDVGNSVVQPTNGQDGSYVVNEKS